MSTLSYMLNVQFILLKKIDGNARNIGSKKNNPHTAKIAKQLNTIIAAFRNMRMTVTRICGISETQRAENHNPAQNYGQFGNG